MSESDSCFDCRWYWARPMRLPFEREPAKGLRGWFQSNEIEFRDTGIPYCRAMPEPINIEGRKGEPCHLFFPATQPAVPAPEKGEAMK